jgi:hypothetical protein
MFWADTVIIIHKRFILDNCSNYNNNVFHRIKLYFFNSLFYPDLKISTIKQELILLSLLNKKSATQCLCSRHFL